MSDASRPVATEDTEVGSYFIANYPPFSVWTGEAVGADALPALGAPPREVPLGLYLHIPFCRKRCHFCYFRVYTDRNAQQVTAYLDAMAREWEIYATYPAVARRPLDFVYFGGGTPSYLSVRQLETLVRRLDTVSPWREAEEVTFECEPGTLTEAKLTALHRLGVTRLSLGVENFDDHILEINGRAHRSPEIGRAYEFARRVGFPQINIDLIAGMLGESEANWQACVEKTLAMAPDSITIYQMELPFNTTISRDRLSGSGQFADAVQGWATKRRWVKEAFEALEAAGYTIGSAYPAVRDPARTRFVYRDRLWEGADLVGLGVASFGHVSGVHVQNLDTDTAYQAAVTAGDLPLARAYRPTPEERLIRELVLRLKRGSVPRADFADKYGVDLFTRFGPQIETLIRDGYATTSDERITLNREGLLRVDGLLPRFFLPEHVGVRYT